MLTVLQGGDIVCAVFRLRQLHTELMPFVLLCTNPWTPPDGLLIFAKSRMRKIEFGGHGYFFVAPKKARDNTKMQKRILDFNVT